MKNLTNKVKKIYTDREIRELGYTSPCGSFCFSKQHKHTFYEFAIILGGTCNHSVDDTPPEVLTRGDFYFITPKNKHQITNVSITHKHRDFYVTAERFEKICKIFGMDFINELPLIAPNFKKRLTESQIVSLEENASYFNQNLYCFSQETLEDLHTSIIVELLGYVLQTKHEKKKILPEWITVLIQKLDNGEFVFNSIEEIVKTTGYAHGYVCREVKKHIGQTLISYNNKIKLRQSINLLETNTVLQTASLLGWDNPKNYSIAFKKTYGITPSEYKKLAQNKTV
jgi:AraC-like DNA-binding protein